MCLHNTDVSAALAMLSLLVPDDAVSGVCWPCVHLRMCDIVLDTAGMCYMLSNDQ